MAKIMVIGFADPAGYESYLSAYTSPNKPKYPDYIKKTLNLTSATSSTGEFKTYSVYDVPDDKIYDALKHLNKRYSFYSANMDGYSYTIELVGSFEDAIAMLK